MENRLNNLLKKELLCSMGCTEPSAIAYAAAYAKEHLIGDEPIRKITLSASSNILKNALCVTIPNTKINGIEMILLLGALKCDSNEKLTILNNISPKDINDVTEMYKDIDIEIVLKHDVNALYIEVDLDTDRHTVKTIVEQTHDQIKSCSVDGTTIYENKTETKEQTRETEFNFDDIYTFVTERKYDKDLIDEVKTYNTQIGEYGLTNDVGLNVGSSIEENDLYTTNYKRIIAKTVAGIDSRMSGVPKKVIINSGSGNQGITATVPIVEFASLYNIPEETAREALTLSHLVTLYVRSKQNKLSSSCGAICAASGVAAGIAYMMQCDKKQIEGAITNLLCSNFGVFCDGAKVTCSLKVASSISSAINAAMLAKKNVFIHENLGVMSSSLDETLKSLSIIEEQLTKNLDTVIMSEAIKNSKGMVYAKKVKNAN